MTQPPVLTFAEIEFLLRAQPAQAETVREHLRLAQAPSDQVVAAGLASLLARDLCTLAGTDITATQQIVGITVALSASHTHTEAVGWVGDQMVLMHVFSGPSARLALFPGAYGLFATELLDPAEPLVQPLTRFLDRCVTGKSESAIAIRSTADGDTVRIAVATDNSGAWYVSDSVDNPDRGAPTSRAAAVQRIAELLGPRPVAAAR